MRAEMGNVCQEARQHKLVKQQNVQLINLHHNLHNFYHQRYALHNDFYRLFLMMMNREVSGTELRKNGKLSVYIKIKFLNHHNSNAIRQTTLCALPKTSSFGHSH